MRYLKTWMASAFSLSSLVSLQSQPLQEPPTQKVQVSPGTVVAQAPGINVLAPVAVAQVGVPSTSKFELFPKTPWFSTPTVRDELKLNEEQHKQLNTSYQKAWLRYNKERNLIDDKLPAEQRVTREGELQNRFRKDFSPAVTSAIPDATVRQRYNQLNWQYQAYDAFKDPVLQEELNLTADQVQKFNTYGTAWNQQLMTWRKDYPSNREKIAKELQDARIQARQRIDETLTPAQRNRWSNLYGAPYEFPADTYFPAEPTTTLKPAIK